MKTQENSSLVTLYVGGCTGSSVVPGERIIRNSRGPKEIGLRRSSRHIFGTHTTSLALRMGTTGIILDNGTGVAQASEYLNVSGVDQVFVFASHCHGDHIFGLMNNELLMRKDGSLKVVYGPVLGEHDFVQVVRNLYGPPFWPVTPEMLGVTLPLRSFSPGDTLPILGGVKTMGLHHAGGAVAYRIPTPIGDIVFATDNELSTGESREALAKFIAGARVAYLDVQYRDEEYGGKVAIGCGSTVISRKNWGHSTPSMLVKTYELIVDAPALTLIGHHDPKRGDEDLFLFEQEVQRAIEHLGTKVQFAREGQIWEFDHSGCA